MTSAAREAPTRGDSAQPLRARGVPSARGGATRHQVLGGGGSAAGTRPWSIDVSQAVCTTMIDGSHSVGPSGTRACMLTIAGQQVAAACFELPSSGQRGGGVCSEQSTTIAWDSTAEAMVVDHAGGAISAASVKSQARMRRRAIFACLIPLWGIWRKRSPAVPPPPPYRPLALIATRRVWDYQCRPSSRPPHRALLPLTVADGKQ